MALKRFGVSLEDELLESLDSFVLENGFANRSQAIRFLVEKSLAEKKWQCNHIVAGTIFIIYDQKRSENRTAAPEPYSLILCILPLRRDNASGLHRAWRGKEPYCSCRYAHLHKRNPARKTPYEPCRITCYFTLKLNSLAYSRRMVRRKLLLVRS